MRFAGAAGSKPLAALPQFSSVPGRLVRGEVGEETLGRVRRGDGPRRAGGTRAPPAPGRDSSSPLPWRLRSEGCSESSQAGAGPGEVWHWGFRAGWLLQGCWDGLWQVQQRVPLFSRSHPDPCGLDKVSHGKRGVWFPKQDAFSRGRALLPSVGSLREAVKGSGCCVRVGFISNAASHQLVSCKSDPF